MKRFKHFLQEEYQELVEKLITFGNQAYPKFGTVVIMAGGAGSGKGFVKGQLLGLEGFTFDVDAIPNMIFDVTLKNLGKLDKLTRAVKKLGYDSKNIHIVWVVNDIEVAIDQNAKRSRMVPVEILVNTHRGVSQTMMDIIQMGKKIKTYLDGDIVFAFNKVGVDLINRSPDPEKPQKGKYAGVAGYIKDANYFYVKKAGKDVLPLEMI
jgi:hypothetical protein